jgi:hypothetical protein
MRIYIGVLKDIEAINIFTNQINDINIVEINGSVRIYASDSYEFTAVGKGGRISIFGANNIIVRGKYNSNMYYYGYFNTKIPQWLNKYLIKASQLSFGFRHRYYINLS